MNPLCPDCEKAEANPLGWHGFHSECMECKARALAHGQAYWRSSKTGRLTEDYRSALRALCPSDPMGMHGKAKVWASRMDEARKERV